MANSKVGDHFNNDSGTDFAERVRLNQQGLIFDARFWRCHRMLHFIACRVLGGSERAEEAIGSCWRIASRHPQRFEHEGEFRSWLLRVLIDEALASPQKCANVHNESVVRTSSCGVTTYPTAGATFAVTTRIGSHRFFYGSGVVGQKRHLEERTNPK